MHLIGSLRVVENAADARREEVILEPPLPVGIVSDHDLAVPADVDFRLELLDGFPLQNRLAHLIQEIAEQVTFQLQVIVRMQNLAVARDRGGGFLTRWEFSMLSSLSSRASPNASNGLGNPIRARRGIPVERPG